MMLNAELQESIYTTDDYILIKHPFVNCLYDEAQNEMYNKLFAQSKARFDQYVAAGNHRAALYIVEKPFRLKYFTHLMGKGLTPSNPMYWETLFGCYTSMEYTSEEADVWMILMTGSSQYKDQFMTESELRKLNDLGDMVTVYRGAKESVNERGISFTTDFDTAAWFAQRFASIEAAVVIEARVHRNDIIAYFEGRGEFEVIIDYNSLSDEKIHYL